MLHAIRSPIAIALAGALLGGCISLGPKTPDTLMTLTPAQVAPAGTQRSAEPGGAVTVMVPTTPQELMTVRVPVRAPGNTVAYLKDAQWVEQPARLFQQLIAATVQARTNRVVLNPRQASSDPGTRIGGDLEQFGVDAVTMEAVVTLDAFRLTSGSDRVDNRRFEARVKLDAIDAAHVTPALNQAANQVAADVAGWVGG